MNGTNGNMERVLWVSTRHDRLVYHNPGQLLRRIGYGKFRCVFKICEPSCSGIRVSCLRFFEDQR